MFQLHGGLAKNNCITMINIIKLLQEPINTIANLINRIPLLNRLCKIEVLLK